MSEAEQTEEPVPTPDAVEMPQSPPYAPQVEPPWAGAWPPPPPPLSSAAASPGAATSPLQRPFPEDGRRDRSHLGVAVRGRRLWHRLVRRGQPLGAIGPGRPVDRDHPGASLPIVEQLVRQLVEQLVGWVIVGRLIE